MSHRVWRVHSEQAQGLTQRELDRLHQAEARLRQRGSAVVDDAVVAVEAVEGPGELERVHGEQMHAAVVRDLGEQLGELLREAEATATFFPVSFVYDAARSSKPAL